MANWLKGLKVNEISLVDAGANRGAVAVLMKRATDGGKELLNKLVELFGMKPEEVAKNLGGGDMDFEKIVKELKDEMEKVKGMLNLSNSIGKVSVAISKAKNTAELTVIKGDIAKLDQTDARIPVLTEMLNEALAKAAHHDEYSANLDGDEKTKFEAMPMKEKDAYMKKNPVKGGSSAGSSEGSSSSSSEDDEMEKRLQEEIKKRNELQSTVEKMQKTVDIQKIMDEDLKDLQGVEKREELAEAIYQIRKTNSAHADLLVAKLKAQAAVIKKSKAFDEFGKGKGAEGSPEAQLETMAKAKASKDGISYAKAYAILMDTPEGKELYGQMDDAARADGFKTS